MDWTGGVRRRFAAGKNNDVIQRQKSHFAKARASLQKSRSSQHSVKSNLLPSVPRTGESLPPRNKRRERTHNCRVKGEELLLRPQVWHDNVQSTNKHSACTTEGLSCRSTSKKRTELQHKSSIIYISSDDQSIASESPSSHGHRSPERREHSGPRTNAHDTDVADEKRLLLAKRRKLLARTDWLGLAALKPVRIKFPSSSDKGRIGKRRKIQSSTSRRGKPAEQRMRTPLFEKPCSRNQHIMSGGLQRDDILVKIGTDVIMSQTQRPRRSHSPGKTSVTQISSEFSQLSEESMLLGPEGNDFGFARSAGSIQPAAEATNNETHSLMAVAGSQMLQDQYYVPNKPEAVSFYPGEDKDELRSEYVHQQPLDKPGTNPGEPLPKFEFLESTIVVPQQNMGVDVAPWAPQACLHQIQAKGKDGWNLVRPTTKRRQFEEEVDDDARKRGIFEIESTYSSRGSITALKSSSVQKTPSARSDNRFTLEHVPVPQCNTETNATLPGIWSQSSMLGNASETAVESTSEKHLRNLKSLSPAFFRPITKLADRASAPAKELEVDPKDEALWKQFIIGSQSSSDGVSQYRNDSSSKGIRDTVVSPHASTTLAVSGLGTSVKSTIGDSFFVSTGSSNAISDTFCSRHRSSTSLPDQATCSMRASHGVCPAGASGDEDSIEDAPPPADAFRQTNNIHVAKTSILNPKRFKSSTKKVSSPARNSGRFRRPRRPTIAVKGGQSIYDLVDSDGISLA